MLSKTRKSTAYFDVQTQEDAAAVEVVVRNIEMLQALLVFWANDRSATRFYWTWKNKWREKNSSNIDERPYHL